MRDTHPCEACALEGELAWTATEGFPRGWVSIDRHPSVRAASWTPSTGIPRVVFCDVCQRVWLVWGARGGEELLTLHELSSSLLPLLGAELTVKEIIACTQTAEYLQPQQSSEPARHRYLRPVFEKYLREASYDPGDAAAQLLAAAVPAESNWWDLLCFLHIAMGRTLKEVPRPRRDELDAMETGLDDARTLEQLVDRGSELADGLWREREARAQPDVPIRFDGVGVLIELLGRAPDESSRARVVQKLKAIAFLLGERRCAFAASPEDVARLRRAR